MLKNLVGIDLSEIFDRNPDKEGGHKKEIEEGAPTIREPKAIKAIIQEFNKRDVHGDTFMSSLRDNRLAAFMWNQGIKDKVQAEGLTWNQFELVLYQFHRSEVVRWVDGTMEWGEFLKQLIQKLEDESIKNTIQKDDCYEKIG